MVQPSALGLIGCSTEGNQHRQQPTPTAEEMKLRMAPCCTTDLYNLFILYCIPSLNPSATTIMLSASVSLTIRYISYKNHRSVHIHLIRTYTLYTHNVLYINNTSIKAEQGELCQFDRLKKERKRESGNTKEASLTK